MSLTPLATAVLLLAACSGSDGAAPPGPIATQTSVVESAPDAGAPAEVDAAGVAPPPACDPLAPRSQPLVLDVLPDAGAAPFVSVIDSATTSLRVMVYQMGYGPILDALVAKAKAGIEVRVVLDIAQKDVNGKYKTQLEQAGAHVVWSSTKFTYTHAKVIVVDSARAVISTGNYYIKRMLMERNYVVVDSDPADVQVLETIFDADFTGIDPVVDCTRLLVSPINAKQRMLDFIASAKTELLIESMQYADGDVRAAVLARKKAGVDVRVLLADPGWIDANASAAEGLADAGIPARNLDDPGVHVKAIIADGARAYVGSINLSYTSLTKNREVGLIVTEAGNLAKMKATFEADWAAATPF